MDRHGGNIFDKRIEHDFSVSLSPLGMPKGVEQAIRDSIEAFSSYPDTNQVRLRKALGKALNVKWNEICCGNGAADLIYRIPRAIKHFAKRRNGLIVAPAFAEYGRSLEESGFQARYHILDESSDYVPTDSLIKRIEDENYDVVFISNPANPTGRALLNEYMNELALVCESNDTFLVVDECFIELTDSPQNYTLINEIERLPHSVLLRSFTKTFAMAGLRLGYCICGDTDVAAAIMDSGQPWSISAPSEAAGLAALKEKEYVRNAVMLISAERARLTEALRAMGLRVTSSDANYIMFNTKGSAFDGMDIRELLIERGILIRDCSNFIGLEKGYYRIAVKGPEENKKLIDELKRIIPGSVSK